MEDKTRGKVREIGNEVSDNFVEVDGFIIEREDDGLSLWRDINKLDKNKFKRLVRREE